MKKFKFFTLLVFISFSSTFSQSKDSISIKIKSLIKQQERKSRALYNYRGAPQSWLKTIDVDDKSITEVLFNYDFKKVGILVYSFENGILETTLFSKPNNRNELPILNETNSKINIEKLNNYIADVNYLFSSNFLNRAPKKRGTITKDYSKKKGLKESFKKLNKLLFPKKLNLHNFEHLIIISTLNIATLPFSAFKVNDEYLVDKMSYSIAPNIFELILSNNKNRIKHTSESGTRKVEYFWENALFVSNPKYPDNLEWSFPDLPGAEEEVNYTLKKSNPLKFNHLNGVNATKTNVLKDICNYDLIYFATHGITDSKNPMDKSYLVLTNESKQKPYITLREIMNIRKKCELKADLVVLSACQTGLGKAHEGGTIGLARAFQIAGANHVLMSLWNIDDKETATLMKFFFDELSIGKEMMPHAALRNAILKYKKEVNDDPKYWAAFSIFGVPY